MCGDGSCATRVVIVDMNAKVSGYDCHNIHMLGWTELDSIGGRHTTV